MLESMKKFEQWLIEAIAHLENSESDLNNTIQKAENSIVEGYEGMIHFSNLNKTMDLEEKVEKLEDKCVQVIAFNDRIDETKNELESKVTSLLAKVKEVL